MDLDAKLQNLLSKLAGVKPSGNGYVAHCPGSGHAHGDKNRSLSITMTDDRILIKCFTGCNPKDILDALNMEWKDLFPNSDKKAFTLPAGGLTIGRLAADKGFSVDFLTSLGVTQGKNHVKISYLLEDGTPAPRQRIRRALKAKDGSIWTKGEGALVPYGLWKLSEARGNGFIILVEGESDTWTLWYHGFPALGFPGADMAGKLKLKYIEGIPKIYAVREPDKGGKTFIAGITKQLSSWKTWCGELFEVRLSELTGAKDPNDLHKREQSKFKEVFQNALDTAMRIEIKYEEKTEKKTAQDDEQQINFTDLDNAHKLVELHGVNLKHVHVWGMWLIWDDLRWVKDHTGGIVRLAKNTVTVMCAEADEKTLKYASRCKNRARIEAMIKLAESEPGIYARPEQFDADPMKLNVKNGTLDLKTGEIKPHSRANLITKLANVEYDPHATAPLWTSFLNRIMNENDNLISFLQRALGYSLTGDISEQVLFIAHGSGDNGKSVFLNILLSLLGDYARPAAPNLLMAKKHDSHPTEIADIEGARLITCVETEENKRLSEALVKQLTGGDKLKARFMGRDFFEFEPTHKLWMATNHRPIVRGTDYAIWKRIRLIPFNVTIPREKRDKKLTEKLKKELPGILNWAIAGCLAWQRDGLGEPEEVIQATKNYQAEMDTLNNFIEEYCIVNPLAKVLVGNIYNAYLNWCKESGEYQLSQRMFSSKLTERGFKRDRSSKGKWVFRGIGLLDRVTQDTQGYVGLYLREIKKNDALVITGAQNKKIAGSMKNASPGVTYVTHEQENNDEDRWD
ncbi:MAG: hypothetical protein A4E71_00061 [Smithella sp. PtaU1.Bin162]|nr:MAG: hypothetical protein A4E71_00061 [Smithella sp. PtaU1.Bin162]